jgi:hypothetical protein
MDGCLQQIETRQSIFHNRLNLFKLSSNKNYLFSIQHTSLRNFVPFQVVQVFVHAILKST